MEINYPMFEVTEMERRVLNDSVSYITGYLCPAIVKAKRVYRRDRGFFQYLSDAFKGGGKYERACDTLLTKISRSLGDTTSSGEDHTSATLVYWLLNNGELRETTMYSPRGATLRVYWVEALLSQGSDNV